MQTVSHEMSLSRLVVFLSLFRLGRRGPNFKMKLIIFGDPQRYFTVHAARDANRFKHLV